MMNLYDHICCDMDGVISNFREGASEILGDDIDGDSLQSLPWAEKSKLFSSKLDNVGFWANLKPLPDYYVLWGHIKPYRPIIVSAFPSWDADSDNYATVGKIKWCRKYLLIPEDRINIVRRTDKQKFAINNDGQPNVLIDDHAKNIKEFEAAGGIGILHTSALDTITKLKLLSK